MGTKMLPSYAYIFMGKHEILIVQYHNISFLDTYTTCVNDFMSTDIYNKSTDKHQYLSPQSCHLKHCTKSIPYSQALRIKRICSNEQTTKNGLGNWNIIWKRGATTMRALNIVFAKQVVLTEKTSSNIQKRRRTSECHLSSHTILRSVSYPTSFVSTGQPYKNTHNCAKSSKNHPSWLSGNLKVWRRADISSRFAYNGQFQKCESKRCMTCEKIQCKQNSNLFPVYYYISKPAYNRIYKWCFRSSVKSNQTL
jgi:hypothetical protein